MGTEVRRTVRGKVPRVSFEKIARRILGTKYSLSLVICGDTLAQTLNRKYRKKSYSPNVLSFPYSKHEGEIILNVRRAALEARKMDVSTADQTALLFIHGCLHLKGLRHGRKMDTYEKLHLKKAGF